MVLRGVPPLVKKGTRNSGIGNFGCAGSGTCVGEGKNLDPLCIGVLNGAQVRVKPVGCFMPFGSIEFDELRGSRPGAVVVEV